MNLDMRWSVNRYLVPALGWMGAVVLVLGVSSGAPAARAPNGGADQRTIRVNSDGPSNCNCSGSDAELSVCHVEHIDVRIGGSTINVNTGQSDSSCGSKTVPDGRCIYYRYNFACERGLFWGWECWFVGTGLKERPATENDC